VFTKLAPIALILGVLTVESARAQQAPLVQRSPLQQRTQTANPAPSTGRLRCVADENGASAPATIEIRQGQRIVANGACASSLELPAGRYTATITLTSALDRPSRSLEVSVASGAEAIARASFATAVLEVNFTFEGEATRGIASVRQNGRELGTLGSGVPARISAGSYEIALRYRTTERVIQVSLAADQRRAVRAAF
jgi:hypothetical protein